MPNKIHLVVLTVLYLITVFGQIVPNNNKVDQRCQTIRCMSGQRCERGICLKEYTSSGNKKLCPTSLVAVRCIDRKFNCEQAKNLSSCGYTHTGIKKDFINDCIPCLDKSISFYYRAPCSKATNVCNPDQQCLNGNCVHLLTGINNKASQNCDQDKKCRLGFLCVSSKCVKITDLGNILQNSNIQTIPN